MKQRIVLIASLILVLAGCASPTRDDVKEFSSLNRGKIPNYMVPLFASCLNNGFINAQSVWRNIDVRMENVSNGMRVETFAGGTSMLIISADVLNTGHVELLKSSAGSLISTSGEQDVFSNCLAHFSGQDIDPNSADLVDIADTNNQINAQYYSITVPTDSGWISNKTKPGTDVSYFELAAPPNLYVMSFRTNWVAKESMKTWTARQIADHYRNGEVEDMKKRGVSTGLYNLKDVTMSEEQVGSKDFYTLSFSTITNEIEQNAILYLYFPKEKDIERFYLAGYSEFYSVNAPSYVTMKSDFMETLRSFELANNE